ncbi:hypothetical protein SASPL_140892 [Salvia splendens]|uniref:beta-ketoacyl-[acyl-carrier-protein] synthase I n=1 Tax=Salvia splendens TaxID=180675 RepID=A0A8X8WR89_SALSN|nr:3-oxoacyl-[acyl-carrier-protein] synthase I, chloroplastic-like [Salvia splendens]KAG6399411.1 hypothetical protein SASPL_140892 [Salvia splendens]
MGSALLAIDTGMRGPSCSVSASSATSNYCFNAAANHIRRGETDVMVAGGTDAAIIPLGLGGFIACRALSHRNEDPHKASRLWDVHHDGFVMGEGAAELEGEVTIDTVPNVKKQHQINVAISNSCGLGAHNSVGVFAPFSP